VDNPTSMQFSETRRMVYTDTTCLFIDVNYSVVCYNYYHFDHGAGGHVATTNWHRRRSIALVGIFRNI